MGTWIEIFLVVYPSWSPFVVPLVGTWIEIVVYNVYDGSLTVVPLVGTWIEIIQQAEMPESKKSFPLWERGLKYVEIVITESTKLRRSPCGNVD